MNDKQIPAGMIDAAGNAHAEHVVTVVAYGNFRDGWQCSCDAGRREKDGLVSWDQAAAEAHQHAARAALAAALDGCEVREQWRYVWSDRAPSSAWFDGKPQHLGREYLRRDGATVTSVAANRRLVITTPAEDVTAVDTPAQEETAK